MQALCSTCLEETANGLCVGWTTDLLCVLWTRAAMAGVIAGIILLVFYIQERRKDGQRTVKKIKRA